MKSKRFYYLALFFISLLGLSACSSKQLASIESCENIDSLDMEADENQVFFQAKGMDKISVDDIEEQMIAKEGKLYESLLKLLKIDQANGLYFIGEVREKYKDENSGKIEFTIPVYGYSKAKTEKIRENIQPFDGLGLRKHILLEGFKNSKDINLAYDIEGEKINLELKFPKALNMEEESRFLESLRKDLIEDIHKLALENAQKRLSDEKIVFSEPLDLRNKGLINYFLVTNENKAYIVSQRDIKLLNENENLIKYDFYKMGSDRYLMILWDRDKIDPKTQHCNLYMLNDNGLSEYKKANLLDARQLKGEEFEIQVIRNGQVETLVENINDIFAYQY